MPISAKTIPLGAPVPAAPQPLTPVQKQQWNNFIDFVEKKGYKGNPILDDRNKTLGATLINEYRKKDPTFNIEYPQVRQVQQELQNYRSELVNNWQNGKAKIEGITAPEQIMSDLSPVDGWLGSKTASHKFPVATYSLKTPTKSEVKNFGTDLSAYDAAMYGVKKKK